MRPRAAAAALCAALAACQPSPALAAAEAAQPKEAAPTVEKEVSVAGGAWSDAVDACAGDALSYRVVATLPGYAEPQGSYPFAIVDEREEAIEVDATSVRVTLGGGEGRDVTSAFEVSVSDGTLVASCPDLKAAFPDASAGDEIALTYEARLSQDPDCGLSDPNENSARVRYVDDGGRERETPEDVAFAYSFALALRKVEDGTSTALEGAAFAIRRDDGRWLGEEGWVADEASRLAMRTGRDGLLQARGLAAGTYELHEVEAPDGYLAISSPVRVTIARTQDGQGRPSLAASAEGASVASADAASGVVTVEVGDPKAGSPARAASSLPRAAAEALAATGAGLPAVALAGTGAAAVMAGWRLRRRRDGR